MSDIVSQPAVSYKRNIRFGEARGLLFDNHEPWQSTDEVLERFDESKKIARTLYALFVETAWRRRDAGKAPVKAGKE